MSFGMSTGRKLTGLLLFTTALSCPALAFAQGTGGPPSGVAQGEAPDPTDDDVLTDTAEGTGQNPSWKRRPKYPFPAVTSSS